MRNSSTTIRPKQLEVTMARSTYSYNNKAEWAALIELGRKIFGPQINGIIGADRQRLFFTRPVDNKIFYSVELTDAERTHFVY